jgi:hypothetical protein
MHELLSMMLLFLPIFNRLEFLIDLPPIDRRSGALVVV